MACLPAQIPTAIYFDTMLHTGKTLVAVSYTGIAKRNTFVRHTDSACFQFSNDSFIAWFGYVLSMLALCEVAQLS